MNVSHHDVSHHDPHWLNDHDCCDPQNIHHSHRNHVVDHLVSKIHYITSSRVSWTVKVWQGVFWSGRKMCISALSHSSSSNLVWSDILFKCTKILQFYLVVSSLLPTESVQQIWKGRSHQWGCFRLKGDTEKEKIRRRMRARGKGGQAPISLADEFTSLTCSAVSPDI